jgi:hypothetical protein
VEPPSEPPGRSVLDRIRAVEDEIRQSRWVEIAVVFDPLTGEELWRKHGTAENVGFSQLELAIMRDGLLTHNHPIGWRFPASDPRHVGTSFTRSDIDLALRADVAELRAVTPVLRFSLKRPASGWPDSARLLEDYDFIDRDVAYALLRDILRGTVDDESAAGRRGHEVVSRLSLMHRLEYSREVG